MGESGAGDWVHTLDEVGRAIEGRLAAVDQFELKFSALHAEHLTPQVLAPSSSQLPTEDGGKDCWGKLLDSARVQADEVERWFDGEKAALDRWWEKYLAWRRLVEQPQPGERGA
ncbi:MAG TPA: hypothetical protein VM533_02055 [Fimbriiglobus sp.]|jgi:hypothetical protein|nr:hypothetical protein [Fimbriiglobus sp.]